MIQTKPTLATAPTHLTNALQPEPALPSGKVTSRLQSPVRRVRPQGVGMPQPVVVQMRREQCPLTAAQYEKTLRLIARGSIPKRLTSLGKFGSGGTLPALFTEDYIYRPHLTNRFVAGIFFASINYFSHLQPGTPKGTFPFSSSCI